MGVCTWQEDEAAAAEEKKRKLEKAKAIAPTTNRSLLSFGDEDEDE